MSIRKVTDVQYGVDVYEEDVASLHVGQWVRTNIVAWEFAQVTRQLVGAAPDAARRLVLLDPSIVQCQMQFGDVSVAPLNAIGAADCVVLPINDFSEGSRLNAGSHWSLLVLHVQRNKGRDDSGSESSCLVTPLHFDSCGTLNWKRAAQVVELYRRAAKEIWGKDAAVEFAKMGQRLSPQQTNNFDCGMFLIATSRSLAAAFARSATSATDFTAEDVADAGADFDRHAPAAIREELRATLAQRLTSAG
jgi:hypothetical protein